MPALATEPRALARPPRQAEPKPEPRRATLDDRVSAVWRRLVAEGAAECLVCGADTRAGEPCRGCGSELG